MALDPIPHVVTTAGEAADAPAGAIPIALYGADSGGEATPVAFSDITGTAAVAQIPSLPASKITSGTLAIAQVPDLAATKIASGTLADARIPALAIAKITGLEARLTAIEGRLTALETPAG